jgi:acetyl-CoA carboxylase carboxyltransferase component
VIANLSGFDGSPESMCNLELEYGAAIVRAITDFKGPIVFCAISRYHGGAFVVFSKTLNEAIEAVAVEGSYASVIGGVPAAAVVFAHEVDTRTKADPRVKSLQDQLAQAHSAQKAALQMRLNEVTAVVHAEKVGEVASEFDHLHTVQRAACRFSGLRHPACFASSLPHRGIGTGDPAGVTTHGKHRAPGQVDGGVVP